MLYSGVHIRAARHHRFVPPCLFCSPFPSVSAEKNTRTTQMFVSLVFGKVCVKDIVCEVSAHATTACVRSFPTESTAAFSGTEITTPTFLSTGARPTEAFPLVSCTYACVGFGPIPLRRGTPLPLEPLNVVRMYAAVDTLTVAWGGNECPSMFRLASA